MIALTITTNLELDPWTDITRADLALNEPGTVTALERVGVLPEGMAGGRATVAFLFRLPDGTPVIAETSLALFHMAAHAVLATPIAEMEGMGL